MPWTPNWAGGRLRRISDDDERFIVATATTRPSKLGRPFTCWSIRKLADYLATNPVRRVVVGRERLRQLLRRNDISFRRTRTWKESRDPDKDAKLDRIEEVTAKFPDRGVMRRRKGGDHTLAAFKSIRATPPGRRTDLHHLRQPVRQHHIEDPDLGQAEQGRAVPDPDKRVLGKPDILAAPPHPARPAPAGRSRAAGPSPPA